jgi:hypothetical protein
VKNIRGHPQAKKMFNNPDYDSHGTLVLLHIGEKHVGSKWRRLGDKNAISTVIHTVEVLFKKKAGVTMRYRCPNVGGCLCLDQGEISRCMWFQGQRFKTMCDSLRFCVKVLHPH